MYIVRSKTDSQFNLPYCTVAEKIMITN